MGVQKIKIQKISNGHFCNAKQFAEDFVETFGENRLNKYYRFPEPTNSVIHAEKTLSEMREKQGEYLSRMKIFIECGLLSDLSSGHRDGKLPEVRPYYDDQIGLACYHGLQTVPLKFSEVERRVEEIISYQQSVVDKLHMTEI